MLVGKFLPDGRQLTWVLAAIACLSVCLSVYKSVFYWNG